MPMIAVDDGALIHVQDYGTGPAVVFVSGFGLDCELWDRQVRVLTDVGYRAVCVTQRGHGQSDHPLHGYEMDRLSGDLVNILDTLGISGATLVGHSFGGQVTFHTAASHPLLVAKLALVGSNAVRASRSEQFPFGGLPDAVLAQMVHNEENNRIAARHTLISNSFAQEQESAVVDWLMQTWLRMPTWSAIASYETMFRTDLVHELGLVRQPVVLINGAADPVHSARGAQWLNSRLLDSTLVELNCGHFPMLEAPVEFDSTLLEFLGRDVSA